MINSDGSHTISSELQTHLIRFLVNLVRRTYVLMLLHYVGGAAAASLSTQDRHRACGEHRGLRTTTSLHFLCNCQLQHKQEKPAETWPADREVESCPTHHMVMNVTTMHCPVRREGGRGDSVRKRKRGKMTSSTPPQQQPHAHVQACTYTLQETPATHTHTRLTILLLLYLINAVSL